MFLDAIHKIRHAVKSDKRAFDDYNKQYGNQHYNIALYNWWEKGTCFWFAQRYNKYVENVEKKINFCSLFGNRQVLNYVTGIKVFFSGENVHRAPYDEYADYLLTDKTISLGLGFDFFEDFRYVRFPLWILYMFKPTSSRKDVIERCKELRYPDVSGKSRFCSMVASHDFNEIRKKMVDGLRVVESVSCAGRYLHNDDSLKNEYNDNKINYLKDFYFNICPENSNSYGYVTEKLFEAISAGCVPVYWGSYNSPEPMILNSEAILFWDMDKDNDGLLHRVEGLYSSPDQLNDFLHLPRLKEGAEDVVWEMFQKLDTAIAKLLNE